MSLSGPSVPITGLNPGTPKVTDVYVAVDVTDTTQAQTGSTKEYVFYNDINFILQLQGFITYPAAYAMTIVNLNATYNNGVAGVGRTLTNAGTKLPFVADAGPGFNGIVPQGAYVLVNSQSAPAKNGLYVLTNAGSETTNWVLTAPAGVFDSSANILNGNLVIVQYGYTKGNTIEQLITVDPVTIGTTAINFVLFTLGGFAPFIPAPIGAVQGDVLYYNGTQWVVLPPGPMGEFLQTQGPAANPLWASATGSGTINSGLINQLAWYAATGTTISGLATANSAGLLTNSSGIPAWVTATGTGAPVLANNPTMPGVIKTLTGFQDASGNYALAFGYAASAVNYLQVYNDSTGLPPTIIAKGTDGTVDIQIQTKSADLWLSDNLGAVAPAFRWYNSAATHYVGFKANNSISANKIWALPPADGTVGQAITTDGAGNLGFSTGLASFWVKFHWTGAAIVIDKSFNVTSVTRTSSGLYVITFTTAMSDANYIIQACPLASANAYCGNIQTQTTTNCSVLMTELGIGSVDPDSVHVVGFAT